jgi:hypothetical protein
MGYHIGGVDELLQVRPFTGTMERTRGSSWRLSLAEATRSEDLSSFKLLRIFTSAAVKEKTWQL